MRLRPHDTPKAVAGERLGQRFCTSKQVQVPACVLSSPFCDDASDIASALLGRTIKKAPKALVVVKPATLRRSRADSSSSCTAWWRTSSMCTVLAQDVIVARAASTKKRRDIGGPRDENESAWTTVTFPRVASPSRWLSRGQGRPCSDESRFM